MSAIQFLPSPLANSISKSQKFKSRINSLKTFMDLTPKSKPEKINIDIQYHDLSKSKPVSSGLRIAEQASTLGIWSAAWTRIRFWVGPITTGREFEEMRLAVCFDYTWPLASVEIDEVTWKDLSYPYGRVSRGKLKKKLMEGCVENGVWFYRAKAWTVEHEKHARQQPA